MAFGCELCGKAYQRGNTVSHANNRCKRLFKANLQRVHVLIDGTTKHIRACTQCIRSGRVVKVPQVAKATKAATT
jgi:large subunit ribosomal protein L28